MSFSIDYFSTLCEQFASWDEMKTHLEQQGLRIVAAPADSNGMVIVRAVKGKSKEPAAGQFRSVVWDTVANRPVCYAPPKAREGLPPLHTNFSAVQDFVDGFMVNAFIVATEPTVLRVATRTSLGGEAKFYSAKTFATLFDEALAATPVRTREALTMHLREWMASASATAAFASFVVQHPEHRIVAKPASPDLHIVHMGTVNAAGVVSVEEAAATWPGPLKRLQITRYPVKQFHSEQEITDLMRRTAVSNGFRWQGLVFKDGTGARWRLRSPSYTMMRTLRGSEAFAVDRFLRLRREGKVMDYLKHYGDSQSSPGTVNHPAHQQGAHMEERKTFWGFEQTLRARTADVLAAYEIVHKAHSLQFGELPGDYKPAVHLLHVKFLEELRPKGYKVILRNAVEVVNGLKEFEQKRLLDAVPFHAPAVPKAHAQEGVLYGGDEEEETCAPEETASTE